MLYPELSGLTGMIQNDSNLLHLLFCTVDICFNSFKNYHICRSHLNLITMQELINRLTEKAGITPEQATISIETIKDFVKEKFPMMAGAVDNLFAGGQP